MRKEQRNPLVYDSTDSYCTQIGKKKGKEMGQTRPTKMRGALRTF